MTTWFDQQHTDPYISQCIVLVLRENGTLTFTDAMKRFTLESAYINAAECQDKISFNNFSIGRISCEWKHVQAKYLLHHFPDRRYSAVAWVKRWVY